MTPELFFILTYPTYDPIWNSVNFPFNFLNFHSDALLCHLLFCPLLFLPIILTHSNQSIINATIIVVQSTPRASAIAISFLLFSNQQDEYQ
jgi:hypothetical protein